MTINTEPNKSVEPIRLFAVHPSEHGAWVDTTRAPAYGTPTPAEPPPEEAAHSIWTPIITMRVPDQVLHLND